MNFVEFAVRNRVTTLMTFLAAIAIGAICVFQFSIDMMPDMEIPSITVMTIYEGAAPEDVETKVTKVLEDALASIPDLKHITSKSSEGLSVISLSFEWQTDLDTRANDARDAIDKAKQFLPDEIDPPRVLKFNMSQIPILIFGVKARESYPRLEKLLTDNLTDHLKRLPGVAMATVITPMERQINVYLDSDRLSAYGLTPQDVVRAISAENQDIPAGNIKMGDTDYLLRVPGELKDVELMKHIVLSTRNHSVIRLADVATVEDGFKELTQEVTINGEHGAAIVVRKQSGANTVDVAERVKKKVKELQKRLPADIEIVPVMDNSEDIKRAINALVQTLWQGGLLAMLVVLIFLRQWRTTLIIGTTIPFSIILALIVIFFLGYTINMMSLFGFVIAVGMIVDNAIVILENITRHREEGERPVEGAIYGTTEVAMAITASTLTTVCIFFPVLFIKGITKIFLTQFAVVASICLLGSLFSALTLTPMLSSVLLAGARFEKTQRKRFFQITEKWYRAVEAGYARLLSWALSHRKTVVLLALILFASSVALVPQLGTEFMPKQDMNSIRATIYMPAGTKVEATQAVMEKLSTIARELIRPEERIAVFTRCGTSATMASIMSDEGSHIGMLSVRLVTRDHRTRSDQEIAEILRKKITELQNELRIEKFRIETTDPLSGMILGGERPLTVNILGDNLEETDKLASQIKEIAVNTPGTIDVDISREKSRPELWVNVDRAKASQLGLNVSGIGDTLRASFYGQQAGKYRIHGDEYDIFVRLNSSSRISIDDPNATHVRLPDGRLVRVDNVAEVHTAFGPVQIDRKDQTRVVNVRGDVYGRALGDVVKDIKEKIQKLTIPSGIEVVMAGQAEDIRTSFFWMELALAVGIALVYMVMASQFESLIDPFVVMFSVPFAFTGVFWALKLFGYHISVVIFIGLLVLVGTVVNNAIVLVDYINILRARGQPLSIAIPNAGKTRLRPVLMTALTTIIALVPMAFKRGQGAEVWNPLGMTIMSGLLVSTLVTLVLVPVVYSLFKHRKTE